MESTLAGFTARFFSFGGRTLTPRGLEEYRKLLDRCILPTLGERRLTSFTTADLFQLQETLRGTPHQANKAVILLCRVLKVAQLLGEPSSTPVKPPPLKVGRPERYLSTEERTRLRGVLAADRSVSARVVEFLLLTGWRKGEALKLRWDEVDFERAQARLTRTKTGFSARPLGEEALFLLASLPRCGEWVFPGATGGHQRGIQKTWERIRGAARLKKFRLHDLRHSFASAGVGAGLSLPVVGALLGHRSPTSTARYAHLSQETLREALRKMALVFLLAVVGPALIKTPYYTLQPGGVRGAYQVKVRGPKAPVKVVRGAYA